MISSHDKIRSALAKYSDGLSVAMLAALLPKANKNSLRQALQNMPDAYIDRWNMEAGSAEPMHAIWMVVQVPDDCPRPTIKAKKASHG